MAFLSLLPFVIPLALDTFAMAAALGMAGCPPTARLRITALFVAFESGMPVLGMMVGRAIGQHFAWLGSVAAGTVLIGLGAVLLWRAVRAEPDADEEQARQMVTVGGLSVLVLGLSVSMDELAMGAAVGLVRTLPLGLLIVMIAVQTVIVTQIGLRLGTRIGDAWREGAERLAALLLMGLGGLLLMGRL